MHKQLLDLGLSCEDLGKTSVHLSIAAKEAPPEVNLTRQWLDLQYIHTSHSFPRLVFHENARFVG